ncbi:MAG: MATE family efflux transporter [Eubacteriales bacterium]|nr:MATE family efflux transporter [Eubacteriales bacterium]
MSSVKINNSSDLTVGVVWKKLFLFFLPIAAGTCIQQLYNAVDGIVVGRFVGTAALAAVGGSTTQIINLIIGFFTSLTAGASVVIAQIYGSGREEDAGRASGSAISFCALMGLALALFGLVAAPAMLGVMKTPDDTFADSLLYLRIYFAGVPFILVLNMESNMLRAVGDSVDPFIYMVVGCVSNIILDFAFVVFFHWAVAGVAIATVIAQIINMALLTHKLITTDKAYRLRADELRMHRMYLRGMLKLGIPAGLQSSMYSVSNMVIQIGVNTLGTVAVASWAMSSKTEGFYWAISSALGAAITTFVGQNVGAGKLDRVKDCVKQGSVMSLLITVVVSSLLMVLAKPVLHILTPDERVVEGTFRIMLYIVPFYFTWTIIEVLSAVMRGAGDAVKPVIIIGLGICLFRILWIGTVFTGHREILVLCLSYPLSWSITTICMFVRYKRGGWLNAVHKRIVKA